MPPRLTPLKQAVAPVVEPVAVEVEGLTEGAGPAVGRQPPRRALPPAAGNSSRDGQATSSDFGGLARPIASEPAYKVPSEPAGKKQLNAKIENWIKTQLGCDKTSTRKKMRDVVHDLGGALADFSGRGLTSLPTEIGQAKTLRWLNLSDNQLTSIPAEMGKIKALKNLHLNNNQLSVFPAEMRNAKMLEQLDLSHNQLTDFPADMCKATALSELDLNNNVLTSFPGQIGQLKRLRVLLLANNALQSFPEEMGQANALEQLDLKNNQLSSFPAGMANAKALHTLDLKNNRLSSFPANMGQVGTLRNLDLSNNELTGFPAEMGKAAMLRQLHLNDNQLRSFPAAMSQVKTLVILNLSGNQLNELPAELGQLHNLLHLSLERNRITQVPRALLELPAATVIDLRENPLPEVEILAVREAMAQRRAAGQSVPQLLMPPAAADAGELRDAAANNMGVHTPVLVNAFSRRLREVALQFSEQLEGSSYERRVKIRAIAARLDDALCTEETHHPPSTGVLRQARLTASLMFQTSHGERAAFHNDFIYSPGDVLAYAFLALEAQWESTPAIHQEQARHNGMTALMNALERSLTWCDTRMSEEVMQTIGWPLSEYAETHPEVVKIQAPPVSTAESRAIILKEAKKVLRELLGDNPALAGDVQPDAWRPTLVRRMQGNHPGMSAEDLKKQIEEIESIWETFHDMVLEQSPAD